MLEAAPLPLTPISSAERLPASDPQRTARDDIAPELSDGGALQTSDSDQCDASGNGAGSGEPARSPSDELAHRWSDGDRTLVVWLDPSLIVTGDVQADTVCDVVADTGEGFIMPATAAGASGATGGGGPVFRSESGMLMALPGGVLLFLDSEWDPGQVGAFFEHNAIATDQRSALGWAINGFFIDTEPGFASLELANGLEGQAGVVAASPNWWTDTAAE